MALPSVVQMGPASGAKMTRLLIGCYAREPHDPEVYVAMLTKLFAEYPEEIGREAVDRVSRTQTFLPNRADVQKVLDEVVNAKRPKPARHDAYEHTASQRRQWDEQAEARKRDREKLEATLGDASADWWNIPVMRRFGGTPAEFRTRWYETEGDTQARAKLLATWGAF